MRQELNREQGRNYLHGPLFFGTSMSEFDVVYDTGSDWIVVEGKSCTNCPGKNYDPATSTSAKKKNSTLIQRNYGQATFFGTSWTDKVCLNEEVCLDSFEYF